MKKVVFSLLMAAMMLPFALQAQTKGAVTVVTLEACDSLTWINGVTYTESTVALYQRNDTSFVLNLTINHSTNTSTSLTADCSYRIGGIIRYENGEYVDSLKTAANCDSVVTIALNLTKVHKDTNDAVRACGSYEWRGRVYEESAMCTDTVHEPVANCDSIYYLPLTIDSVFRAPEENVEHCGSYTWRGVSYSSDTTVVLDVPSEDGCDSIFVLNLNIVKNHDTTTVTACEKYKWTVTNQTYTESIFVTRDVTGIGSDCVTEKALDLTIIPVDTENHNSDTTVQGCNRVRYKFKNENQFYVYSDSTASKTYTYRTESQCFDSTSVVHFIVKRSIRNVEELVGCDKVVWSLHEFDSTREDKVYTFSQVDSLLMGKAVNGCDSLEVRNITINPSPIINSIDGTWAINPGEEVRLTANCSQEGLQYAWEYNGITVNEETLVVNPGFTENTDVSLTVMNPTTTCNANMWITVLVGVGINDVEGVSINLYPNPTTEILNVVCSESIREAAIFNTLGQQVCRFDNVGVSSALNLSTLAKGTYTMRLTLQDGNTIIRKFIVTK